MAYQLISSGLDVWDLFGFGKLPDTVMSDLERMQRRRSRRARQTPWRWAGEPLLIERAGYGRGTGKRWDWPLYNAHGRVLLRPGMQDGIVARFEPSPALLYGRGGAHVATLASALLVELLGAPAEMRVAQLRLCADLVGFAFDWNFGGDGKERLMVHPHGRCPRLIGEARQTHPTGTQWEPAQGTGLIGQGQLLIEYAFNWPAPGACRLHDRLTEMKMLTQATRQDLLDRWRAGGWDEQARVLRVEFTYDYPCLVDAGVERPADALAHLDTLWSYATTDTVRLVKANEATPPQEWKLAPLWKVVQTTRMR